MVVYYSFDRSPSKNSWIVILDTVFLGIVSHHLAMWSSACDGSRYEICQLLGTEQQRKGGNSYNFLVSKVNPKFLCLILILDY